MIADELLGAVGDMVGDGLGFFDKIKESVSKVANKIPAQAKTAAAMTPQGQAVMAAQQMASKQKSGKTTTTRATSVIPVPGRKDGKSGAVRPIFLRPRALFSILTKKKILGVPILYAGLGTVLIGLPILKKLKR